MIDFKKTYSRDEILDFLKDSLLKDFQKDVRTVDIPDQKYIQEAYSLGYSSELELSVFEFLHEGSTEKRVTLTKEAFNVLRDSGSFKAIGIFHSKDTDDWRFSLMTATPTRNEKNKVQIILSNPKRYSFLLGPNAKVNTPTKFLITKGEIQNFEDLKERFSIEVVNKEFYKEISKLFIQLVGGTLGKGRSKEEYKALLRLPGVKDSSQTTQEFAVRLIGRLIFCWFLREKKNGSEESLMPHSLLSLEASKNHKNYYHNVLEPIFFKVLNVPLTSRKDEKFSSDPYDKIPYLNGGLFSPHDDDFYSTNDSKQENNNKEVVVPDKWLQELFEILETYNFTIDENSAFDEELSIDPEMLGRIFENLLAEINPETGESARKSTGSYYTPRVIVDYMVDESLYLYLKNKTEIEEEKLRSLISYDLDDDTYTPLTKEEKEKIISAIDELKILDPACGSGAFPMGALQKIVFILQQLDPNGQYWFKAQIKNVPVELRKNLEREHSEKNFDYIRKLGVIRRNIFGVDIQPIATEISRLRCFLTLIVDQKVDDNKNNRGIDPLPNLDFKFVTANSLISLPEKENSKETIGMFEDPIRINELKDIRDQFFNASNFERNELKLAFKDVQLGMSKYYNSVKSAGADLTEMLLSWDPFSHKMTGWFDSEWMFGIKDGFDIVIGNPPYIASYGRQAKKFSKEEIAYYIKKYETFKDIRAKNISINTVMLFFEKGLKLLKKEAILSFIVDQAFLNVDVYSLSRRFVLSQYKLHEIVTDMQFPNVVAEASILFLTNSLGKDTYTYKWKAKEVNTVSENKTISPEKYYGERFTLTKYDMLVNKIEEQGVPLSECAETSTGMQIIPDIFLSNDDSVLEKEKWHKAVFSKNILKYQIVWPTKNQKGKYITYDTLLQDNIRKDLARRRSFGEKVRSPESLSIGSAEKEKRFFPPKIIISQTVSNAKGIISLQGALDEVGYYGNVSIHIVKHQNINILKILLAILNSKLISFYAIEKRLILGSEKGSKKTPQIRKGALDLLPVKLPDGESCSEIVSLVDEILHKNKVTKTETDHSEIHRIDEIIYELYSLSEDEVSVVEGFFM